MTNSAPRLTKETLGSGALDLREWREFAPDRGVVKFVYEGDEDISNIVVWCLQPGQENSTHKHPDSAHFLVILEGSGVILRGDEGEPDPIHEGQVVVIPRNVIHGIRNTGDVNLSYGAFSTIGYHREAVGEQRDGRH